MGGLVRGAGCLGRHSVRGRHSDRKSHYSWKASQYSDPYSHNRLRFEHDSIVCAVKIVINVLHEPV